MWIQSRRERAEREKLLVTAARELVEAEGWEAVMPRRLAEQVAGAGAVQPLSRQGRDHGGGGLHLPGREPEHRPATTTADEALAAVARAYLSFADRRPALYDTMFSRAVDLPFATAEAPAPLKAGFNELAEAIRPHTGAAEDQGLLTETFWAALHGLITLTRGARLPREAHDRRLALLLDRFTGTRH